MNILTSPKISVEDILAGFLIRDIVETLRSSATSQWQTFAVEAASGLSSMSAWAMWIGRVPIVMRSLSKRIFRLLVDLSNNNTILTAKKMRSLVAEREI